MATHTPIVSMWFFSSNFRAYAETEGITKGIEIGLNVPVGLGLVAYICHTGSWVAEEEGSEVQGQLYQDEFQVGPGYNTVSKITPITSH